MNRAIWPAVAQAFRQAAPPLACYYAVTLALPLANGAAQAGAAFVEHARVVIVLPPVLILLAWATRQIMRVLNCELRRLSARSFWHPLL
jgi:hypothetical protein